MSRKTTLNGKEIVDATEPLTISVTKRDLKKARQRNPMCCALAQGCAHLDGVVSSRIGTKIALIELEDKVQRYAVQPEDTEKIRAFDNANYFQAGTYTLVPPEKKLGVHTVGHHKKYKSGPSEKRVSQQPPLRHVHRDYGYMETGS